MRVVVTSDLHHDRAGHLTAPGEIEALAQNIARERPEVIILAGDLGHGLDNFRGCVSAFLGLAPHLLVLAGNHDIWRDEPRRLGSRALLEEALPALCSELGAVWLEAATLRLGGVAIVGSMAWYDYSGIDPEQGHQLAHVAALKGRLNNDAHHVDWPESDPEVAARLGGGLLARLALLEADPAIHTIVVATHVPVLEEQMARKPGDAMWGLSNAFFGNLTLGKRIRAHRKVSLVVSGHTHLGRAGEIARPWGPLRYAVVPSDYGEPASLSFDVG